MDEVERLTRGEASRKGGKKGKVRTVLRCQASPSLRCAPVAASPLRWFVSDCSAG